MSIFGKRDSNSDLIYRVNCLEGMVKQLETDNKILRLENEFNVKISIKYMADVFTSIIHYKVDSVDKYHCSLDELSAYLNGFKDANSPVNNKEEK